MLRKAVSLLSGLAVVGSSVFAFNAPSYASGNIQFQCDTTGAIPATVARNKATGKKLTVIRWYSEYFAGSGYDSTTRCMEVSDRFHNSYRNGSLDYITAGIINGMPVICAATPGSSCNNKNILFTLKKGTNAAVTLQRLFDVRDSAGPSLMEQSDNKIYVNLGKKLAPLGEANALDTNVPSEAPSESGRAF